MNSFSCKPSSLEWTSQKSPLGLHLERKGAIFPLTKTHQSFRANMPAFCCWYVLRPHPCGLKRFVFLRNKKKLRKIAKKRRENSKYATLVYRGSILFFPPCKTTAKWGRGKMTARPNSPFCSCGLPFHILQ